MNKLQKKIENLEDIKSCVNINENNCWNWLYGKTGRPYGALVYKGKVVMTHRLSYQFQYPDEDISNKVICHKCDNTICCNPEHLFAGTQKDNIQDRISKGRSNYARGENNGATKLTNDQVNQIRFRYKSEKISQSKLSSEYGVGQDQISRIVNNKRRGRT